MPREHFDSHQFLSKNEILSYEELAFIVESLVPLGLQKNSTYWRRTTTSKRYLRIHQNASTRVGFMVMTTNGLLLERFAKQLAESGLNRVTVSLDALDVETFQAMGDTNETETVLRGIEAARMAGLKVKINTVIRAGYNEHSVEKIAERFFGTEVIVRYIEFMDVGETNSWIQEKSSQVQ